MRIAILSDIHSNLAAFQAVLRHIESIGGMDKLWCLGDVVGYGPDPHECIALLQRFNPVCVAGNHDLAAVGAISTADFNTAAARANQWTAEQLTEDDCDFLQYLPPTLNEGPFTLVHGSPREPVWEYLFAASAAQENFPVFTTAYCMVGHTHVPVIFEERGGSVITHDFPADMTLVLGPNRLIINPGGVGQPRDHDPRASYAVYDTDANALYHYRVEYEIRTTQEKMESAGLPEFLIARLSLGR